MDWIPLFGAIDEEEEEEEDAARQQELERRSDEAARRTPKAPEPPVAKGNAPKPQRESD